MKFDWEFYINHYEDLPKNGIINEELAKCHWNNHGRNEGRICNKYQINNYKYENKSEYNDENKSEYDDKYKKNIAILFSGQMRKNSLKSYDSNDNTIINSISKNFINEQFKKNIIIIFLYQLIMQILKKL